MPCSIWVLNRNKKQHGKILFINAKNEITRKDSYSYLEEGHISKILNAYKNFSHVDNFAETATIKELLDNHSSLSVSLYVNHMIETDNEDGYITNEIYTQWEELSNNSHALLSDIISDLKGGAKDE